MPRLSEEEKEEMLRLSRSEQLNNDFRRMREYQQQRLKETGVVDLDSYIAFATAANAFANHSMKAFRKIQGDNFKL